MSVVDKKIKIGIIGVGSISEAHLLAYSKIPDVEIYAFCDINEARLKEMGERYGVTRLFTDKNDMLALSEIDAVSVCTWNSQHAPCTIAALKAGKHVMCEKPMAMNTEEALEMKKTAEESGKLLMVGFVRRYKESTELVKEFAENGTFGDIYYTKATYLRRHGNPGGWFGDKSRSGGGPLIDLGVHVIDMARYVMGNPMPVSAYGVTFNKLGNRKDLVDQPPYVSISSTPEDVCDVEEFASAVIRFDNGAAVSVETSFDLNLKDDVGTFELFGTRGGAKFSPELEIYTDVNGYMADVKLKKKLDTVSGFTTEFEHFIDCIKGEAECKSPAEDGVIMMKILDAIYESAKTGEAVKIK